MAGGFKRSSLLFESFVPLLIGGPLIAIAALYGSFRALAPGGEMDSGYEKVGLAMAPLGFEVTERPKVNIEVRESSRDFAAKSRKLKVESGPEGIVVTRKGTAQADWLCDLWLAERLANAA